MNVKIVQEISNVSVFKKLSQGHYTDLRLPLSDFCCLGDYVKYNSNSGFTSDDQRRTPQAFSHFTFEKSNREKMVVDIQGVSDLWTDPQIHSANGLDYGDGNLGVRGMALFLLSHQ